MKYLLYLEQIDTNSSRIFKLLKAGVSPEMNQSYPEYQCLQNGFSLVPVKEPRRSPEKAFYFKKIENRGTAAIIICLYLLQSVKQNHGFIIT